MMYAVLRALALISPALAFAPSSPALRNRFDVDGRRYDVCKLGLGKGENIMGIYSGSSRRINHAVDTSLHAKNRKNKDESFDSWYDDVDDNASPEDVFWEEMERRRLLSMSGVGEASSVDGITAMIDDVAGGVGRGSSSSSPAASTDTIVGSPSSGTNMSAKNPGMTPADERSTESALSAYSLFAVSDNYLYEDDDEEQLWKKASSGGLTNDPSIWIGDDLSLEEENAELDRQLDELERELMGDGVDGSVVGGSSPFFDTSMSDEPWDRYGESNPDNEFSFSKGMERKMAMVKQSAKEFTLEYDDEHPEEAAAEAADEEADFVKSLSTIGITSQRLENALANPKAGAFFKRSPDERQGFDAMWVAAIDSPCMGNLVGSFSNYGIQFADNFDDWQDGTDEDATRSIEDIASYKARRVFQVTGLPCIAARTSFEVEPIRPEDLATAGAPVGSGGKKSKTDRGLTQNSRVASGYRFNVIGEHVEHIIDALLPYSEPTRVTRFRSCVCFYDGEMEIFEYGELDCDLYFANVMRTFIPMATAINAMMKSLELALDLQFQKWLRSKVNDSTRGGSYSLASIKLRDRVLKEAKVLPNDIIDVSSFMDAFVDVELMDECGRDLAERFIDTKPSKILTIATTGLVIAIPMAKYLQVPLVYARKQRSVVMADTFDAGYNSKTIGRDRQLLVSKDHLDEDDRVLIVDDFLSSGSGQEALLRIISEAGATPVGVGVLLEKEYEKGRVSLSGFGVPVESVVRIASVRDGVIQLLEEDGYDKM